MATRLSLLLIVLLLGGACRMQAADPARVVKPSLKTLQKRLWELEREHGDIREIQALKRSQGTQNDAYGDELVRRSGKNNDEKREVEHQIDLLVKAEAVQTREAMETLEKEFKSMTISRPPAYAPPIIPAAGVHERGARLGDEELEEMMRRGIFGAPEVPKGKEPTSVEAALTAPCSESLYYECSTDKQLKGIRNFDRSFFNTLKQVDTIKAGINYGWTFDNNAFTGQLIPPFIYMFSLAQLDNTCGFMTVANIAALAIAYQSRDMNSLFIRNTAANIFKQKIEPSRPFQQSACPLGGYADFAQLRDMLKELLPGQIYFQGVFDDPRITEMVNPLMSMFLLVVPPNQRKPGEFYMDTATELSTQGSEVRTECIKYMQTSAMTCFIANLGGSHFRLYVVVNYKNGVVHVLYFDSSLRGSVLPEELVVKKMGLSEEHRKLIKMDPEERAIRVIYSLIEESGIAAVRVPAE